MVVSVYLQISGWIYWNVGWEIEIKGLKGILYLMDPMEQLVFNGSKLVLGDFVVIDLLSTPLDVEIVYEVQYEYQSQVWTDTGSNHESIRSSSQQQQHPTSTLYLLKSLKESTKILRQSPVTPYVVKQYKGNTRNVSLIDTNLGRDDNERWTRWGPLKRLKRFGVKGVKILSLVLYWTEDSNKTPNLSINTFYPTVQRSWAI